MTNKERMLLGEFIARMRFVPWQRGINDCMTLCCDWHDTRFGTNTVSEIRGKYTNLRQAIRFNRKHNAKDWCIENGYTETPPADGYADGDIVLFDNGYYYQGFIIAHNFAHTLLDEMGYARLDLNTLHSHTVWRQ